MDEKRTALYQSRLETSQAFSRGNPDKLADIIADALLDELLRRDEYSSSKIEILTTTDYVVLAGQIRCGADFPFSVFDDVVRTTVRDIGFDHDGFSWKSLSMNNVVISESLDIAMGVDTHYEDVGSGDTFSVHGYSTNETDVLMPAPILYANRIISRLDKIRLSDTENRLGPEAQCQVSMRYIDGLPAGFDSIIVTAQHFQDVTQSDLQELLMDCIQQEVPDQWLDSNTQILLNPTGLFIVGGPVGDVGVTGHKTASDTYGGIIPSPEGLVSGRDPSKLQRSSAYLARYIAKNIVAASLAKKCEVRIDYAIGVSEPIGLRVNTFGTGKADEREIEAVILEHVDCRPRAIIKRFGLQNPIYKDTAAFGAFGREVFAWEHTDIAGFLHDYNWQPLNRTLLQSAYPEHSPEFPINIECRTLPGTQNAAVALLFFFKDVLDAVGPPVSNSVAIQRVDDHIRMSIDVVDAPAEPIFELLEQYTAILKGARMPEEVFEDQLLIARLQSKLDESMLMLRNEQRLIDLERRHHQDKVVMVETYSERLINAEKEKTNALLAATKSNEQNTRETYEAMIKCMSDAIEQANDVNHRWYETIQSLQTNMSSHSDELLKQFGMLVAQKANGHQLDTTDEDIVRTLEELAKNDVSTFSKLKDLVLAGAIQTTVGNAVWTVLTRIPWATIG